MRINSTEAKSRKTEKPVQIGPKIAATNPPTSPVDLARKLKETLAAAKVARPGEADIVASLETGYAKLTGARFAVSFNSGSAALFSSLHAARAVNGYSVVTTPLASPSAINAISICGATPVFSDVDDYTLTLDPMFVRSKLSPYTKAIFCSDIGGHPGELDALAKSARSVGALLIEDAGPLPGAEYEGRMVGSIADITVFGIIHPVGTCPGYGGMALTNDRSLAESLRMIARAGLTAKSAGGAGTDCAAPSLDFRMPEVNAALGIAILESAVEELSTRRKLASAYGKALDNIEGLLLPSEAPLVKSSWQEYLVRVPAQIRDELVRCIAALGIEIRVPYTPVHLTTWYKERYGNAPGICPVAENASMELFSLPLSADLQANEHERIIKAVKTCMGVTS